MDVVTVQSVDVVTVQSVDAGFVSAGVFLIGQLDSAKKDRLCGDALLSAKEWSSPLFGVDILERWLVFLELIIGCNYYKSQPNKFKRNNNRPIE